MLDPVAKGVSSAVLAEHQIGANVANVLGTHDLVGAAFLQDAVLMNASFVGECVLSHDRFVALDEHSRDA